MNKLIRINPLDNVVVVREIIEPLYFEQIDEMRVIFEITLGLGHKVAAVPIKYGEKIIKFGVPIGSATMDIDAGAHVHVHNMKSDYIDTYTRDSSFFKS